ANRGSRRYWSTLLRAGRSDRSSPPAKLGRQAPRTCLNPKGLAVRVLGTACGLLCDSCGLAELPRRDPDDALEAMGEWALIREAGARRDLGQGEVTAGLKELLRPVDAAGEDVLVRRQPGCGFELSREVVGAEVGRRRHLPHGQLEVEVSFD